MNTYTKKILIGIVAVLGIFFLGYKTGSFFATNKIVPVEQVENKTFDNSMRSSTGGVIPNYDRDVFDDDSNKENESLSKVNDVPEQALIVLNHIRNFNEAPEGYVGGRTFQNREGILPKTNEDNQKIKYQEWDVNQKISGKNRGAERLVTSEKDAYYTNDHYKTFTKINE